MAKLRKMTLDVAFRLIIVLSLIGSLFVYVKQEDLSNCVARWANDFTVSTQARSIANTNRIDSLNRLIVDIIAAPNAQATSIDLVNLLTALAGENEEAREVAAQQYLRDIQASNSNAKVIKDTRDFLQSENTYLTAVATHPIPDPPKEVC